MTKRSDITPIVDGILRVVALGGLTATILVAPGAVLLLDKPLRKYFARLDSRSQQREMRRILAYMKRQALVTEDYEHGMQISKKARKRLEKIDFDSLSIKSPPKWDKRWRILFYDIPESHKKARDKLAFKLRKLGCQQLQRSVWVHPFPCEEQVAHIALLYDVDSYITFIETSHINNAKALEERFSHLL